MVDAVASVLMMVAHGSCRDGEVTSYLLEFVRVLGWDDVGYLS